MRDHATFQMSALTPKETKYAEKAVYFMNFFQTAYNDIEKNEDFKKLYPRLVQGLMSFIDFKKTILRKLLTCCIEFNLPPSNITHQLNEANQFLMMLTSPPPKAYEKPMRTVMLADMIKLWITDVMGHAATIASFVEPDEMLYIDKANEFKMLFGKIALKASDLQMMLTYTGLKDGSLELLAEETIEKITEFSCFCEKIKELRSQCKLMAIGTFVPLIPDHFIREQNHWIEKIKEYLEQQ
jgi:hypothetical protein